MKLKIAVIRKGRHLVPTVMSSQCVPRRHCQIRKKNYLSKPFKIKSTIWKFIVSSLRTTKEQHQQEGQCTFNATLRRVRVATVAVEEH